MNRRNMVGAATLILVTGVVTLVPAPVAADIIITGDENTPCGGEGGGKPGRDVLFTITGTNGDSMAIYCVDGSYYEGLITKASGTSYPFGRCLFLGGVNLRCFAIDEDFNLVGVAWINADPNSGPTGSKGANQRILQNALKLQPGESCDEFVQRGEAYLTANSITGRV
jgi:hypothetical protein